MTVGEPADPLVGDDQVGVLGGEFVRICALSLPSTRHPDCWTICRMGELAIRSARPGCQATRV